MKEKIIENFLLLASVPRQSHHEKQVSDKLYQWAKDKNLDVIQDAEGNIIINKPGTPGHENAPTTILQGHMDMVCVANPGVSYNPLTDPIHVLDDGINLTAAGTSLGGDDGIGVAMTMAILEDESAEHGPIRGIFTVDEEDGMTGAEALDAKHLQGDYLINLDWEEYGSLCCSSAGSDQYKLSRQGTLEASGDGCMAFSVKAADLTGGHSGSSIHCGRANAIKEVAGMLQGIAKMGIPFRLASFQGGSAHNAIPSSAEAICVVKMEDMPFFLSVGDTEGMCRKGKCLQTDPDAKFTVTALDSVPEQCFTLEDSLAYIGCMDSVFNGVNTMSSEIEGLVESSNNIGLASTHEAIMECTLHARSSEPARMAELQAGFREDAQMHGFEFTILSTSPAWPVKAGSHLVEICSEEYKKLMGKEISVEPVHAGLECGCFSNKNPKLDIISIGPDILDIHSPRETLVLQTVYDCDDLVRNILKVICK